MYHPLVLRFFLVGAQYRSPINYTQEALDAVGVLSPQNSYINAIGGQLDHTRIHQVLINVYCLRRTIPNLS